MRSAITSQGEASGTQYQWCDASSSVSTNGAIHDDRVYKNGSENKKEKIIAVLSSAPS